MMCSMVMSAYLLGKMVNKAPINGKKVRFHNELTFYCGFNKEIEWIEGDSWRRRPFHNTFPQSFHLLVHMKFQ